MTARKVIGVLAFGLALAIPPAANAQFRQAASGQRYVPGEAIVRFAPGVAADERREARGDARVSFEQSLGLPRAQVVSFDGSVGAAIRRLEDEPGVAYAQPNYRYHALAPVPNDTHFGHLWGLSGAPASVDVLPAWDRSRGAGQVIAILDTGVDLTHPDLAGNLWTGPGGIHGMDFVDGDTHPDDFNLHGTHVAGTAAAIADNGAGVAGVAPQAQIMAVRVLDGDGGGTTDDIVDGIDFAAANGASVINMSLGGPSDADDTAMANAISAAAQNVVVVAAAGNEAADNDQVPTTPCTFGNANLICVAAVTRTGARSGFSNFGRTTVDLGAPGGTGSGDPDSDVLSAKPSWSVPLFSDDFDSGIAAWTPTGTGDTWGVETGAGVGGSDAVTDSPGALYQNNTNSQLQHDAIDLSGQRGCLLDFLLALEGVEDGADFVGVGVVSGAGEFGVNFTGDSEGFYQGTTISVAGVERDDAKPTLRFDSDAATRGDGAYIDDLNLICRAESYNDEIAADDTAVTGDSYTAIAGTSMAAPHVAGVAALVRAVDPGAPPSQVVDALRQGAKPAFGMVGVTVTGGVVDAVGAIDSALAIANEPPPPPPPPPPTATPPNRPRFGMVSVNRRGVVTVVVRGDAATTGVLTLAANITRPRRPTTARVRRVGRKRFRIGSARRARVRVKLIRPARRQLARRHTLRLRVRAVVTNAAGLSNSRTARIRITQRRRR